VADADAAHEEYGIELVKLNDITALDAVIAAVPHREVLAVDLNHLARLTGGGVPFMDVKAAFDRDAVRAAGFDLWRL